MLLLAQLSLSYKAWFWWQAERLSPTEIDSTREPWSLVKPDFRQSLIDNPANAHYYLGQAEALEKSNFEDLKLFSEVDGLLRSAIFRAPADWVNRLKVGEVYLRAFRIAPYQCIPKALKELAATVQLFPASGLLHLRLGKVLAWAEHNYPGSVPADLRGQAGFHIKEALRLDPHLEKSLGPEEPSSSAP